MRAVGLAHKVGMLALLPLWVADDDKTSIAVENTCAHAEKRCAIWCCPLDKSILCVNEQVMGSNKESVCL